MRNCPYCFEEIPDQIVKCPHCGEIVRRPGPGGAGVPRSRLHRSTSDRMLAGVCGGLAEYAGVDPTLVRLLMLLILMMSGFFPVLIVYIVMVIVVPEQEI